MHSARGVLSMGHKIARRAAFRNLAHDSRDPVDPVIIVTNPERLGGKCKSSPTRVRVMLGGLEETSMEIRLGTVAESP
jgi:hypothetical protein